MGAEDLTDNEEDSIDDGTRVVPRNRRDLTKDAMPLWHLLTHAPANHQANNVVSNSGVL